MDADKHGIEKKPEKGKENLSQEIVAHELQVLARNQALAGNHRAAARKLAAHCSMRIGSPS
jgi:hypothetical protein